MPGRSHSNSSPSDLAEAVARAGVTDRAVLDALYRVPRAAFVPEGQLSHAYQDTALLAQLCRVVWSVEWFADLAEAASTNLATQGVTNVEVVAGDGSVGLPQHAPFDGIVVSAAAPRVPRPLSEQLAEGGRLVHPLGQGGSEDVVCFHKRGGDLVRLESVTPARFVPLRTDDRRR